MRRLATIPAPRRARIAAAALALGALALGSAGCSPSRTAKGTTTSSTTLSGGSTTTLPAAVDIPGTAVTGQFALLGTARRVPVPDVPDGAAGATLPTPGQPGFAEVEQVGYRIFGSGPPLLLVMGQDGSMTWWDPSFLALLAQHYQVVEFDLPGIGYSAPPTVPLTLDLMADDTAGLIDSLGLTHPTVLGWGLGGAVALDLAERHPGSVGALVLVDATAGGGSPGPTPAMRARLGSVLATPSSLAGVMFGPSHHLERDYWLLTEQSLPPDAVTRPAIAAEARVERQLESSDSVSGGLAAIGMPILVVDGSADRVEPSGASAALSGAITGSEHISYPGGDYGALFEFKAEFVKSLEHFTG